MTMKYPEFQDRGVLITGAGSGMGRATAMIMAASGARLVLVDINNGALEETAEEITGLGAPPPLTITADVSRRDQVEDMGARAGSFLPSLDYMVASAGIMRPNGFTDITPEEWGRVVDVNLTGAFLCCREVLPGMLEKGRGSIVLVASMAGRSTSVWGGAHYTASKHWRHRAGQASGP